MHENKVIHPKYGMGFIIKSRHKGFELLVDFGGKLYWVRRDELREPTYPSPVPGLPQGMKPDEHFKSRRMIEAFRLGIVPYDCVDEFTFGRDSETQQLVKWLSSQNGSMLIVGDYGSGKTHLLHYTLGRALQDRFAVSWVEMDPNEAPFHKPKRVYKQLIQNLRYPLEANQGFGRFRDFLKEVLVSGALKDHRFFKHLIGKENDDHLWEWIEAKESIIRPWDFYDSIYNSLPGLYDYSTAANIYCYLLSALGWAAKEVMGLKGLLLVFDEAETVEINYYSYQAEKGRNFLRALIRTANNEEELMKEPCNSDLDYCGVGTAKYIPFLYKNVSGIKLLFAFTSLDWNYQYYSWNHPLIPEVEYLPRIDLEPLPNEVLKEIFENICLLYDSAYNYLEEDATIEAIFRKLNGRVARMRLFVKGAVEALDLARLSSKQL